MVPESTEAQTAPVAEPSPDPVKAQVGASLVYDDNVYWEPQRTADFFWRISPEIVAQHRSPRLAILGSYTFDAERFFEQQTESTPFARQRAAIATTARPTATTTLRVDSGFASTTTPFDFNVSTGLGPGRFRARTWDSQAELTQAISPQTTLRAAYIFSAQFAKELGDISTQTFEGGVAHRIGAKDTAVARFVGHHFAFNPGDTVHSEAALVGWVRKVNPHATVSLEAGPRYTLGTFKPEVLANVTLQRLRSQFGLTYAATQTTAVGIRNTIDVQRVEAQVTHRLAQRTEASLKGTMFVDTLGTRVSRVYRVAAGISGPVTKTLWFAVGYSNDRLEGNLYRGPEESLSLKRNVVFLGLTVVPWSPR